MNKSWRSNITHFQDNIVTVIKTVWYLWKSRQIEGSEQKAQKEIYTNIAYPFSFVFVFVLLWKVFSTDGAEQSDVYMLKQYLCIWL